MRTETITPDCFTIFDAKGLDPITVVIQDMGGCGRLIVECYGKAWSTYFGAFGTGPMREFLTGCDVGYVANRLEPRGGSYLHDITAAVLTALRPNASFSREPERSVGESAGSDSYGGNDD